MKKSRHFLMAVALLACHAGMAQITATFKPNAVQGQDVQLRSNESCPSWANTNYGTGIEINPSAWTYIGLGCGVGKYRSLLRFDALSSLPAGAVIQHAELRLYGVASSGHTPGNTSYPGSTFGTSNELWVRRVTGSWNEGTATWNNQPGFTTVDQVAVPASTSRWNHHVVLNVTSMVNAMMAPGSNHGFIIMLQNEAFYRSMLFASSDHPDTTRWPELYVQYSLPTSTCTANIHFDFNSGVQGSYIFTGIGNFWVPVTSVLWQFGDGKQSSQWPVVSHTYNAAGKYRVCLRINYANGCSAFNCIDLVVLMDRFVAFKVAGQSDAANSQPTLFPNPVVGDVVNVLRSSTGSTNVQYRVVDVTGRVLMTGKLLIGPGKQAVPVKLPGLRPGMYTIELTGWEKPYRVNFIKK